MDIDEDEFKKSLKPCPFCGRSDLTIDIKMNWGPINKPREIISVGIHHWCERAPGQLQLHVEMRGRDHESAKIAWNKRIQPV